MFEQPNPQTRSAPDTRESPGDLERRTRLAFKAHRNVLALEVIEPAGPNVLSRILPRAHLDEVALWSRTPKGHDQLKQ